MNRKAALIKSRRIIAASRFFKCTSPVLARLFIVMENYYQESILNFAFKQSQLLNIGADMVGEETVL